MFSKIFIRYFHQFSRMDINRTTENQNVPSTELKCTEGPFHVV